MDEDNKLSEAGYFLKQLNILQNSPEEFKHNLSAFLSASRSALQYAFAEAQRKSGGKKWYDNRILKNRIFAFFKDKRDFNIHEEPVNLQRSVEVGVSGTLLISGSLTVVVRGPDGQIKETRTSEEQPPSPAPAPSAKTTTHYTYKFDDWSGSEDVIGLCQSYLGELTDFVQDGQSQHFLS